MSILRDTNGGDVRTNKGTGFVLFIIFTFLIILLSRLFYLQIIKGEDLEKLSENNRLRQVRLKAPRGRILDRNGRLLAGNRYSFNILLVPADTRDLNATLTLLREGIGIEKDGLVKEIKSSSPYKPFPIRRDVSRRELAFVAEHSLDLPGVYVETEPVRDYVYGPLAAHMLGYIGEVTEKQLRAEGNGDYRGGDLIGQYGLEALYERYLHGSSGKRYVEVDAAGKEMRELGKIPPLSGNELVLTIDLELQELAESLMKGSSGALVAMDPNNGEVLAMVSNPSFDPNLFANRISRERWRELADHPLHPLNNRIVRGQYPPGSTFKIVTAVAGLEEGAITPETVFQCKGYYYFGGRPYRCWKRGGHGAVNLQKALVQSCDVYFYNVGTMLSIDALARYARGFGLGSKTGVGLKGEEKGLVPSTAWKSERLGEPWFPGENLSSAIGQGYNLVTPIQMATLISAVANGGKIYQPRLVREVVSPDGSVLQRSVPHVLGTIPARKETLSTIRRALAAVVNDPHGTGAKAKSEKVIISGKTGTAQVVRLKNGAGDEDEPEKFRDHAWFIAFAPFEHPQIAVAILVEHAGRGGSNYAPWAKELIERYLNLNDEAVAQSLLKRGG